MSIKALVKDMSTRDVASLYVKSFDGCQGPKSSIRTIFAHAWTMAPCLLIFEDLDSLVQDKLRSYFLNEVDGLENDHGILMVGSTDHIEQLDPSTARRTRGLALLSTLAAEVLATGKIDFDDEMCRTVVDLTDGYTFAYMNELFVQSLLVLVTDCVELEKNRSCEDSGVRDMISANIITTSNGHDLGNHDADSLSEDENDETVCQSRAMKAGQMSEHGTSHVFLPIIREQAETLMHDMDLSKVSEPRVWPQNDRSGSEMDPTMFEMSAQAVAVKRAALANL